ncbi:hypothetical protein GCU60_18540 [Blastococcus saxobsidens]|uniref:Ig-like domain-containing protein n=1 Tax=Blastococcus saxobsidens TaxID=138336 RepID=A0A6L9W8A1_9ACTN|nr:hypothetical protein [Blastococcus saxobsidens]NEK87741.1 hypothetical protein [Blastococcus saxobsidens]
MSSRPVLPRRTATVVCVVIGVGLLGPGVGPAGAAPEEVETVTSCTEAALRQAIDDVADGGTVAIACDDPIVLTPGGGSTIVVDKTMTISGTGHTVTVDGGRQTSLFAVQSGGGATSPDDLPTLTLRDLTLTGGWSQDEGYYGGGAVWNLANLVVERVHFQDNRAFNRGGAILSEGAGRLTVVDSTFTGNRVTCPIDGSGGGAIAVRQRQQTTISGSVFDGNSATGLASGGAVLAHVSRVGAGFPVEPPPGGPVPADPFGAPLVITDSVFRSNEVTVQAVAALDVSRMYGGGAVAALDHPLTVSDTLFEDNVVTTPAIGYGGAVLAASFRQAATTLTGVDVFDNGFPDRTNGHVSNGIGGGLALHGTPSIVEDTIVDGNLVGGGLYTRGGPVELVATAVENNVAGAVVPGDTTYGGGLASYGPVSLTDSTVLANSGGSCRILWGGGPAPAGDIVVDGGGNDVDDPGTCFRLAPPTTPPAATGALVAPTAPVAPGSGVTVEGAGFVPGARITLAGYLLGAPAPGASLAAAATTGAATAPGPVDLGAGQADATGAFSLTPVLPTAGVWQIVALGAAADGTTAALTAVLVAAAPGVDIAPVVTSQPVPVTAAAGTQVTLSASAAGAPAPTVQWQSSQDGGTTWTDVAGATGEDLTVTVGSVSTRYRAVFTNAAGSVTSAAATVTGSGTGTPTPGPGGGTATPVATDGAGAGSGEPSARPTAASAPALATTGSELLPLVATGVGLLLAGAGLVLAVRRRPAR